MRLRRNTIFSRFADTLERIAGTPYAFAAFCLWCIIMPKLNIDLANYGISVITALMLFLTIGSDRRDRKAAHVKLDDLERSIDVADSAKAGIEQLTEAEIEAAR